MKEDAVLCCSMEVGKLHIMLSLLPPAAVVGYAEGFAVLCREIMVPILHRWDCKVEVGVSGAALGARGHAQKAGNTVLVAMQRDLFYIQKSPA